MHEPTLAARASSRLPRLIRGALLGSLATSACTLITDVDREKIPEREVPEFPQTDAGTLPTDAGDAGREDPVTEADAAGSPDASGSGD